MKQLKSHVRHDDPEIMSISHVHVLLLSCAISLIISLTLPSWSPVLVLPNNDNDNDDNKNNNEAAKRRRSLLQQGLLGNLDVPHHHIMEHGELQRLWPQLDLVNIDQSQRPATKHKKMSYMKWCHTGQFATPTPIRNACFSHEFADM